MPIPARAQIIIGWILCAACAGLAVWALIDAQLVRGVGAIIAAAIAGPGTWWQVRTYGPRRNGRRD